MTCGSGDSGTTATVLLESLTASPPGLAAGRKELCVVETWYDAVGRVQVSGSCKIALEDAVNVVFGNLIEHAVPVAAQARNLVGCSCAARSNRDDAAVSSQMAERV